MTLVVDASAWFHDPALRGHLSVRHWRRLPPRTGDALRAAAAACERAGVRATWFVAGDVAAGEAERLRTLAATGHEIAFAATSPVPLAAASASEQERLARRWTAELAALEQVTGRAIAGARATWLGGAAPEWWRAWLRAQRLAYDASGDASDTGNVRLLDAGGAGTSARATAVAGRSVAAWCFDADSPRLAGLSAVARAAHDARIGSGERELASLGAGAGGTLAAALEIPAAPPPRRATAADAVGSAAPDRDVPRLAIVVPLKDEEAGIASLAIELDIVAAELADVAACELVLVDDGSTDRTWPLLREHFGTRQHCTLVQHEHNQGVAAAIRTGIRATDAPLVASIDGDLSYDPAELRAMLALATTGAGADVVTASPYHPRGGVKNVPGWRLFLSRSLSRIYRVLLRSPLHTWTACQRVYRRAAVVDLPLDHPGFLGTAELLVRVLRRGGTVVEHPCVLEARLIGHSKMRTLRVIRGHLGLLWRVALRRVT